jgi:flagellar basal-body rod protein FlgC
MDMLDILRISSSGMKAQRTRMEAVATNLANVHSTKTDEGGPFRKKEVVFTTTDVSDKNTFGSTLEHTMEGVKVEEIVESQKPFERVYEPYHPHADASGYVSLPNVNVMEEMSDMVAATRAYEANVSVAGNVKQMFQKSLEIGQ